MGGSVEPHSPTLPSLHLRHSSFTNPSVGSPTSQLILQPFCCFTYVTALSTTLPSLYLHHSSLSNPFAASPTSQLILQPFRRFTYVTAHSPTLPLLPPTSQLILHPFFRFPYVTGSSYTSPGETSMFALVIRICDVTPLMYNLLHVHKIVFILKLKGW